VNITIPYNYEPREYQLPFLEAMDAGKKRAVICWHRRAGKEKTCWNYVIARAIERKGSYYYFFPTNVQARKVLWDGMDSEGFSFLSHIPSAIRDGEPNSTEMKIRLKNGSIIQVLGTDNYDNVRGTNPLGCVFSEYSYQDPRAWDTFRPILNENKGWAIFNFTPNGRNHAHDLYRIAQGNQDWFSETLTVRDTKRPDSTPVITEADIQAELDAGMDVDMIQQEYYCSFTGVVTGTYYGRQMEAAERDGRIGNIPWEPLLQVSTYWDLGIGDAMAIWFVQSYHHEIRIIDYHEESGEGLAYYIKMLREKPYVYGKHHAPHDIEVRELGTGKSRLEVAAGLGLKFEIVKKLSIEDGIEAVRDIIPKCYFDVTRCKRGIDTLLNYHKQWDEKRRCFGNQPVHDWSSNGADAFRYFAVGYEAPRPPVRAVSPKQANSYAIR